MSPFISAAKDEPEESQYIIGFQKGLNTAQDRSLVDDKNLIQADNIDYVVDGIRRRPGTTKVYDEGGATKVQGSSGFYIKTTSSRYWIRGAKISSNTVLQYLNGSSWTSLSGSSSLTDGSVNFVQARDKMFVYNGTDALRYIDSALAITTYTALATPTGLAVTPTFNDIASISGITRSSQTATATTSAAHGKSTGDVVIVSGAAQSEYNGTFTITVTGTTTFTYTVSGTPATPATGTITYTSGGATSYSYSITSFNSTGESAVSSGVSVTTGPKTLSALTYNRLAWNTVANADGYNIYGRTSTGFGRVFLGTVYGASTLTYDDTGSATPNTAKLAPSENTTGGIVAKFGIFTQGRQFVAGAKEGSTYYPTRLYYSGVLNYVDAFVGGEYGGGWVEISSNDGGEIVDLKPYQGGVVIWKTNGVFKFTFTSAGLPSVQEITRSHGGVAFRASQSIDNDIVYVGQKENRIAVYTLGQQENYTGDQLRTNELTVFIQPSLENLYRLYQGNMASFYYKDKFGFTYTVTGDTENTTGFVLDIRFGGWAKWDGGPMEVTHYTVYDDATNAYLYGGSTSDGYMVRLFENARNDNGAAFRTVLGNKFYNGGRFDITKIWRNPVYWFKYITGGSITAEVWADGTKFLGSANLSSSSGGAGLGVDLVGVTLFGSTFASIAETTANADLPKELTLITQSRSLGFYLIDANVNSDWLLMGLHLTYSLLEGKPLEETSRIALAT